MPYTSLGICFHPRDVKRVTSCLELNLDMHQLTAIVIGKTCEKAYSRI